MRKDYDVEVFTVAHGQPRAYADHRDITQVKITRYDHEGAKMQIVPDWMGEDIARKLCANNLPTKDELGQDEWWKSYLHSIKKIESKENTWEVYTVTPYVD